MGLFDKIKKAFDTGGIKVELEAPKKFDRSDQSIPTRVTVTGHESEPRSIQALTFTLKDDGDNQGMPGMRNNDDGPRQGDGRRFSSSYDHLVALELGPGESRTFEVAVPLAANGGPSLIDRMSFAVDGGATLHFGDQWYVLSVSAPVEGANMARADKVRLKASGQLGERHLRMG